MRRFSTTLRATLGSSLNASEIAVLFQEFDGEIIREFNLISFFIVKHWMTFNEPFNTCENGYGVAIAAPGILGEATQPYLCAHTILQSHARAYRLYEREFKEQQQGRVGIVIDSEWMEPDDPNNATHIEAAERALRFKVRFMIITLMNP